MSNEKLQQNKLPEKESINVNDKKISDVTGGYTFYAGRDAGDTSKPFEVIDDANGDVLGRYDSLKKAEKAAKIKRQSKEEITSWNELYRLRRTK